jgi:hypothetical protein
VVEAVDVELTPVITIHQRTVLINPTKTNLCIAYRIAKNHPLN